MKEEAEDEAREEVGEEVDPREKYSLLRKILGGCQLWVVSTLGTFLRYTLQ